MARPKLHLDADVSNEKLLRALLNFGHDVTRTPNEWMPFDASDEAQLLGATGHGRSVLTFNIRDFFPLAERYPLHRGIVLAAQRHWTLSALIAALDRLLSTTTAEEWVGRVRWMNGWRDG